MNTKEKYALAEEVINHALNSGAQQASAAIDESVSSEIEIRDQKIDKLTQSNRNGLTINLYVDNKYSSNSTSRLKKDELFRFIDEAIAATRYLAEDQYRSLPDQKLYYKGGGIDLNTCDLNIASIDTKTKIEIATQVLNEAYRKDERIITVSSGYADSIGNRVLVTSNGFKGDTASSNTTLYASVSVRTDKGRPSDYWAESALFFDKLKKTDIGKKALERTLQKIAPQKIRSGKYTMVVENRAAENLLYPLYSALQGYSLYQKQSFLIGKSDRTIASKIMTVTDDPLIPSGAASRLFDGEGLAAVSRPIIEDGILRNYFIDTYYGKKLGMAPTSGGSSNMVFRLGPRDLEGMVRSLKKGIVVTGFNGGNCNGSTGDFSYGIEGYLVENGTIVHPVNEMNITGNMNQIFLSLVEAGNDIIEGNSNLVPSLMFEAVDFSGI
ncbi:MAG: TldD/PmbA family protein [Bacteroidales bacterium]|nr:TldD/PmbA family protein [Bacteroidales bacterium]